MIEHSIKPWKAAARLPSLVLLSALATVAALAAKAATALAQPRDGDPITIALMAPQSGPRVGLGRAIDVAGRLAVDAANASSKTKPGAAPASPSPHFRLVGFDDGCNAEKAIAAAAEVIAAHITIVIGHPCANAAASAAPLYAKAGILFIATGSSQSRSTAAKPSPLQFRIPAAEPPIGTFIGETLAALPAEARVALVRDHTALARGITQDIFKTLTKRTRPAALIDAFAGGDKDFTALVARLKAAAITHLALAAFPNEGALLVAEARTALPELVIITTDLMADPETARVAGTHADGMLLAMATDLALTPVAKISADAMQAALASDPLQPWSRPYANAALATLAAIEVVTGVARQSKSLQPLELANALATGTFATTIGPLAFNDRSPAKLPAWALYTWRAGTLVAVDR